MKDNRALYQRLRRQHPVFEYVAYHHKVCPDGLRLWFDFRMGDVEFHPTALVEQRDFLQLVHPDLDQLVFNIGMAELVSYWKCACSPEVRVLCGHLDEADIAFWRKLYALGLGEFYYTNGLDMDEGRNWTLVGPVPPSVAQPQQDNSQQGAEASHTNEYLVPIGGGKDSVVTLELLRQAGMRCRPLIMNPRGATVECTRVAGFAQSEVLVVRRSIDPTLLRLNAEGYLNGHTPFSAMLACYTMLCSALSGVPNVALSNEQSANESTVLGTEVNHQYSKSLDFEDDFRAHCAHMPLRQPWGYRYFSFLRPLSELHIAQQFSQLQQYHAVFRSCNVGSKQDVWCGHCAKCLFAYIILSPFIEPGRLNAVFGKPMLDDTTLHTEFDQLVGAAETKPFECVGTVDEVRHALAMTLHRWYGNGRPALLEDYLTDPVLATTPLAPIAPLGNLTHSEFEILNQACIRLNN